MVVLDVRNSSSSATTRKPSGLQPAMTMRRVPACCERGQTSSTDDDTGCGAGTNSESSSAIPMSWSPAAITESAGGFSSTSPPACMTPMIDDDSNASRLAP